MNSPARQYRYYEFVMAAFVTVLICSNLIGPAKIWQFDFPLIGEVTPGAGVLFFPISYVFGDILTEVYGYARSRRVIWAGFAGLAFAALMAWIVVRLPPAPFWENQAAYEIAFGSTWRIAAASLIGFLCGEFVNSFVSTIFGEGVDSLIFYPLAFWGSGLIPDERLPQIMLVQFVSKVGIEVALTPLTYAVVGWLKRAEQEDYYDRHTDFNPFTLRT